MYFVEKAFRIPIGHRLSKHKGLCCNIHGHNWKLLIKVKSETLNQNDMIIDFYDLKTIVDKLIITKFDHCLIVKYDDRMIPEDYDGKIIRINCDPTAEFLSRYIYEELEKYFNKSLPGIFVDQITLYENDDSSAMYRKD
jgi:6-pyruvoyltetrahydropterin/6-carboxytetrahydropterin synthase